jgi:hypothetical protein
VTVPLPIDRIVRPEPVAVRVVWPGEATHFTPWLAANLDWLDVLGLGPLQHLGTEVPIAEVGRNLDILASTPGGLRVAIENQYQRTDHDHLTRGLAYALGVRPAAKALVVISEDHRPEFVAIADYLNTAYERLGADDGIAVFLVTLAVERVGDSFVPRFEVVSRPNAWLAEVQSVVPAEPVSIETFLASCQDSFRDRARRIISEWTARAGASMRINPASKSVALDYPYSPTSNHRTVYVLYNNDLITVNRGYFIESGTVSQTAIPDMDAQLRAAFPHLNDKPYYPTTTAPSADGVAAFADWLQRRPITTI